MIVCPGCSDSWPEDRFNGSSVYCFRCRARSLRVSFGPGGKQAFHDMTVKEFNDRQISEARANGLDPQPVHTAATAVPNASQFAALNKALTPKGNK